MTDDKRYYWIKLKTDFFNEDEIDFLLSQKNGCEYVVLYQMLCLKTANTSGKLQKEIGEIIVPYNIEKIARDTKYFDVDTVTVALELYKRLGLVYVDENGALVITKHETMIGSETSSANRVREWRKKKNQEKLLQCNTDVTPDVTQEYRDKSIEIRDKNIDIDIREKENKLDNVQLMSNSCPSESIEKQGRKTTRFSPPTLDEVRNYCRERQNNVDPERWYDFYQSKGWMVGRNKMKDWKAAVRTWEAHSTKDNHGTQTPHMITKFDV